MLRKVHVSVTLTGVRDESRDEERICSEYDCSHLLNRRDKSTRGVEVDNFAHWASVWR